MEQEQFYRVPHTLERMREGLLGAYIDAFAQRSIDQGYARSSVRYALQLVADLDRWLKRHRILVTQVTTERIACYLTDRSGRGRFRPGDTAILRRLLNLLIEQRIVEEEPPAEPTARERLATEFQRYLEQERRLAPPTVRLYLEFARQFLAQTAREGEAPLANLQAADVVGFVQREAVRLHHAKRAKLMTTAVRSLLQYARYRGLIEGDLRASVPTVANWSMASLPYALSSEELQRLLSACERETAVGQRNWAILQLLARLGLRAGEVVKLTLEDLDWAAGELSIQCAGSSANRLPLPPEVGAALADYLRHVRPACASRRVFIRMRAPCRGFLGAAAVSTVVRRALARAGLDPAHSGAHLLRHTVATQMLRRGASLPEIGELLRHRSPQTTMIYAKVDLDLLRPLALPWPGGAS